MSDPTPSTSPANTAAAPMSPSVSVPDVNLLPTWYPQMVSRRRWLRMQAWATGVVLVVLGTILVLRWDNEHVREYELQNLASERERTEAILAELTSQEQRLAVLAEQASLVEQVGLPLEVTRVLAEMARTLPTRAALTLLEVKTERREPTTLEKARAVTTGRPTAGGVWMRFRVQGIAPSRNDLPALMEHLQEETLFRDVFVSYGNDVVLHGRQAVEFEVSFTIDLALSGDRSDLALAGMTPGVIP